MKVPRNRNIRPAYNSMIGKDSLEYDTTSRAFSKEHEAKWTLMNQSQLEEGLSNIQIMRTLFFSFGSWVPLLIWYKGKHIKQGLSFFCRITLEWRVVPRSFFDSKEKKGQWYKMYSYVRQMGSIKEKVG